MSKRIGWVDIAKAISILFIVLAHSSTGYVNHLSNSFNTVVFFVLSGMTFCRMKEDMDGSFCFDNRHWSRFAKTTFKSIIVPYVIWAIVSIVIYALMGRLVVAKLELDEANFSIVNNNI